MLGLLLVLACNAGPHPLAQLDLREERAALLAADSAFAVQASQALLPAFRDILDDDAIFLDPGERVVVGKAATLAMLASDGVSAAGTQAWRAVRVDVSADGGAGYTYGFGSVTGSFGPGGAARALPVKYMRRTCACFSASPRPPTPRRASNRPGGGNTATSPTRIRDGRGAR